MCPSMRYEYLEWFGLPAADSGKATNPKNYFFGIAPPRTRAEGGQVLLEFRSHKIA